jgi:hypothetical protein
VEHHRRPRSLAHRFELIGSARRSRRQEHAFDRNGNGRSVQPLDTVLLLGREGCSPRRRTLRGRLSNMHWPERWWPRDRAANSPIREKYPHLRPTFRQRFRADWYDRFDWPGKKPRRFSRY